MFLAHVLYNCHMKHGIKFPKVNTNIIQMVGFNQQPPEIMDLDLDSMSNLESITSFWNPII